MHCFSSKRGYIMNMKKKKKKDVTIKIRISQRDKMRIQMLSDVYVGGDISKWIRYAALHCAPESGSLK